jgi:hypothetical protein
VDIDLILMGVVLLLMMQKGIKILILYVFIPEHWNMKTECMKLFQKLNMHVMDRQVISIT